METNTQRPLTGSERDLADAFDAYMGIEVKTERAFADVWKDYVGMPHDEAMFAYQFDRVTGLVED